MCICVLCYYITTYKIIPTCNTNIVRYAVWEPLVCLIRPLSTNYSCRSDLAHHLLLSCPSSVVEKINKKKTLSWYIKILKSEATKLDDGFGCGETVKEREMSPRLFGFGFHYRMNSSTILWDRQPGRKAVKSSVFGMWNWRCLWGSHRKCSVSGLHITRLRVSVYY